MLRPRRSGALAVTVALVAAACSGGGGEGSPEPAPAEARTVTSGDGLVTIEVPSGVDADVSVEALDTLPEELAAFELRGAVHELLPAGATFEEPVTVQRTVDPEQLGIDLAEGLPVIGLLTKAEDGWRYLDDQTLAIEGGHIVVTGTTGHFSPLVAATTGAEISADHLAELPVGRSFDAVLRLQPGVTGGRIAEADGEAADPLGLGGPVIDGNRAVFALTCGGEGPASFTFGTRIEGVTIPPLEEALGISQPLATDVTIRREVGCLVGSDIDWEEIDRMFPYVGAPPDVVTDILGDTQEDPAGDVAAPFDDAELEPQAFTDVGLHVAFAWTPKPGTLAALNELPLGEVVDGIEALGQGTFRASDRPLFAGCVRTREPVPWSPGAALGTIELGVRTGGFGEPSHDASESFGWAPFDGASVILGGRVSSQGAAVFIDAFEPSQGWFTSTGEPLRVLVTDATDGSATTYCAIAPLAAVGGENTEVGFFVNQLNFQTNAASSDFTLPREYRLEVGFRF